MKTIEINASAVQRIIEIAGEVMAVLKAEQDAIITNTPADSGERLTQLATSSGKLVFVQEFLTEAATVDVKVTP